jgi:hypothetical protein
LRISASPPRIARKIDKRDEEIKKMYRAETIAPANPYLR